ncbi:MAG: bacterial transcriptional activator domain-containing protein [Armatimonadetes bacterium]|nr:bacterial transcriptional activator domain-containing protein [Armatimonadota bacterium]
MTSESTASSTVKSPGTKASVLITITTPGSDTPICRLSNSEDVIRDLTVRQLLERVVSPNSLFSVGVPMSQLQAENATAMGITELMSADCCEVVAPGKGAAGEKQITLDQPAREVAREQVGTQGNRFLNISLEVRSAADAVPPGGDDRRQTQTPSTDEIEQKKPVLTGSVIETQSKSPGISRFGKPSQSFAPKSTAREKAASENVIAAGESEKKESPHSFGAVKPAASASTAKEYVPSEPTSSSSPRDTEFVATAPSTPPSEVIENETSLEQPAETKAEPAASSPSSAGEIVPVGESRESRDLERSSTANSESHSVKENSETEEEPEPPQSRVRPRSVGEAPQAGTTNGLFTILAEKPKDEPKQETHDRKEYARKSDWLRAQFLPEVEALDFSGLFVGNLGLGIRQDKGRKNVVLADPARITEVLLRANGYRRTADHAKALICYQELVDMDPSNADFRFLLGKTFVELGQQEEATDAFQRAKELGHDGAERELEDLKRTGHRPKAALGFLKFWKQ